MRSTAKLISFIATIGLFLLTSCGNDDGDNSVTPTTITATSAVKFIEGGSTVATTNPLTSA